MTKEERDTLTATVMTADGGNDSAMTARLSVEGVSADEVLETYDALSTALREAIEEQLQAYRRAMGTAPAAD